MDSTPLGGAPGASGASTAARLVSRGGSGGNLLLDEVGELTGEAQVKLLRFLETRSLSRIGATREIALDVRVLCATHRDLRKEIAHGRFREDRYYRINAFVLRIPPLRKRRQEILLLAALFLKQHAERIGRTPPTLSESAGAALLEHRWPTPSDRTPERCPD